MHVSGARIGLTARSPLGFRTIFVQPFAFRFSGLFRERMAFVFLSESLILAQDERLRRA